MADTRCRKWQITINNPIDKGYTHDKIREFLNTLQAREVVETIIYCSYLRKKGV